MTKEHHYSLTVEWKGNKGEGTADYRSYGRDHTISAPFKPTILASSDPSFRGDKSKYNPEELLISALSSCHMLWFLHLCADHGIVVTAYLDRPTGIMIETPEGGGKFKEVTLRPEVTVQDGSMLEKLEKLHEQANQHCFISNSVNFPVKHQPIGKTFFSKSQ